MDMTLADFIKRELERTAALPTMREWLDQVRQDEPIRPKLSAVEIIRELRDGR